MKTSARTLLAVPLLLVPCLVLATASEARGESVAPVGSYVAHEKTLPILGTYQVTGVEGGQKIRGTLVVRQGPAGKVSLEGALEDGRAFSGSAPEEGPWVFAPDRLGAPGEEMPASARRGVKTTLRLLPDGKVAASFTSSPKGAPTKVSLEPTRRALVITAPLWVQDKDKKPDKSVQELQSEERFFTSVAEDMARYFAKKGETPEIARADWKGVREKLLAAAEAGTPYDRVVFVCHSGWDGPILGYDPATAQFSGQTYANGWSMAGTNSEFERLVDAVRRGTTADARIYVPVCHGGGSDRYERADPKSSTYIYADDLARRTGRLVAGPEGRASAENSLRLVKAVEGEGTVAQETRVAQGAEARTIDPEKPVILETGPRTGITAVLDGR